MTVDRIEKLARLLVSYSTSVQPGEWVGILGEVKALPLLRPIYAAVLEAGGQPTLILNDEVIDRMFLQQASDEQMNWLDPTMTHYLEQADVYIRVGAPGNTRALTNMPGGRMQKLQSARQSWLAMRMSRAARGEFKWVGTLYPTEALAQEANMSLEEYEAFVYGACFCDREDPAGEWRRLSAMQEQKVKWLKGKKQVRLEGPNIDLTLSIEDRIFINADGARNMPDGEIFTGPVEDSVNGWVRFSYPSIVNGRAVSGIELQFEQGRVISATAEQNDDLLQSQLNTDAGSRYLGEFAIGTNFGIQQFTGSILYDEKIGGTVHMAVGAGYPDTGSKNKSAIHWDMICDMRQDSRILVDNELFYENGSFVV